MRCIACQRYLIKSASPSMAIGPVCLKKVFPQPKRCRTNIMRMPGEGRAVAVSPGQLALFEVANV